MATVRQLSGLDAQFLALESTRNYGHVSGLAVYDPSTAPGGELTVKDVCRLVGERLHLLPPFRWKLAPVPLNVAQPFWIEDPDFDIDFHIRELSLPPGATDRTLARQVERIVSRPLDRAHPLWELYLLHNLPDGHVALLTKVHHAAIDGVSGAEILGVLLDEQPSGREIAPAPDDDGVPEAPGALELLGRGLLSLPLQPVRALRTLPAALPNLPRIPTVSSWPGVATATRALERLPLVGRDGAVLDGAPTTVPRTRFNGRISRHRRFAFASLPLDAVKAVKNAHGVTVNDVVVAICAGALRSWLLERDELPADPLVAMVPISVRSEEERGTYGNRVSALMVPIPTDEADPVARLHRAHEVMRAAKERHSALPAHLLQDMTAFIPAALNARAARVAFTVGLLRPAMNVVVSNVPGPRVPLYCAGARLVAHYPVSVITDGVGLNITVQSYLDALDFGIVADRDQVDDAWPLMDHLRAALEEYA